MYKIEQQQQQQRKKKKKGEKSITVHESDKWHTRHPNTYTNGQKD